METEIRFYYSLESEEKIINNLKKIKELEYDDKYDELCKEQNMKVENIVTFDKDMPKENNKFML